MARARPLIRGVTSRSAHRPRQCRRKDAFRRRQDASSSAPGPALGERQAGERIRVAGPGPQRAQSLGQQIGAACAGALGEPAPDRRGRRTVAPRPRRPARQSASRSRPDLRIRRRLRQPRCRLHRGGGALGLVLRGVAVVARFDAGARFDQVAQRPTVAAPSTRRSGQASSGRSMRCKDPARSRGQLRATADAAREYPCRPSHSARGDRPGGRRAPPRRKAASSTTIAPSSTCETARSRSAIASGPRRQLDLVLCKLGQIVRPTRRRVGEIGEGRKARMRMLAQRGRARQGSEMALDVLHARLDPPAFGDRLIIVLGRPGRASSTSWA